MKRKGVSGVITAVLLVAIVIVAVVIVYTVVVPIVRESSTNIQTDTLTTDLELKAAKILVVRERDEGGIFGALDADDSQQSTIAEIQVKRPVGKGDVSAIKFIFKNKEGETYVYTEPSNIEELETKTFGIPLT